MNKVAYLIIFTLCFIVGCSNEEPNYNNELPSKIMSFVSEYYPDEKIESYSHTGGSYQVVIDFGPTLVFNSNFEWTTIDGNGSTLQQQLIYDQLPQKLYNYLEQTGALKDVFGIRRDSKTYTLTLLNSELVYTISTGSISSR